VRTKVHWLSIVAMGAFIVAGPFAWTHVHVQANPQDDPAKPQVLTFEMVLMRAVEAGGQSFARRASELAPAMSFAFPVGEVPIVSGIVFHDLAVNDADAYVFHVQVPGIDLTLLAMDMVMRRPQMVRAPGVQAVGNGRVSATGVVEADPMEPPLAATADFRVEYRQQVTNALIDAILDNSGVLPLAADDALLVTANGIEPRAVNPLLKSPAGKLVLRAKGADLAAFRQGKITREEARTRIQSSRF